MSDAKSAAKSNAKSDAKSDAKKPAGRHEDPPEVQNPKMNPQDTLNQIKDPDDWVTGQEPMTGAQASYLKTLSEQAHNPEAYDPELDKAEASKRIDQLRQEKQS